mgnify:CR=1 FL=1
MPDISTKKLAYLIIGLNNFTQLQTLITLLVIHMLETLLLVRMNSCNLLFQRERFLLKMLA